MTVAIQGQPGSFSEAAATALVPGTELISCESFDEAFDAVATGRARFGVVPVHNAIVGEVYDNAARARRAGFRVLNQLVLPIRQCLIAAVPRDLRLVRRIASHPIALRQCERFFRDDSNRVPIAISDTGSAVRDLMRGTLDADGAIASAGAARRYGAVVLLEGIDDSPANATTFVLFEHVATAADAALREVAQAGHACNV
jgi:prephenate dehydratase